jgi:hypothetical protein
MTTGSNPSFIKDINNLLNKEDDIFWKEAGLLSDLPATVKLSKPSPPLQNSGDQPFDGLGSKHLLTVSTTTTLPSLVETCPQNFIPRMGGGVKQGTSGSFSSVARGKDKHLSVFRRHKKLWKSNKVHRKMVLGSDVALEDTCRLAFCALVGRFAYGHFCRDKLPIWANRVWSSMLGYSPELVQLPKGWWGIICRSLDDVDLLLARRWLNGDSSFMLKKWRVSFNQETKYFMFRHLWILLLGLPLHMWNEGALKDIGDALDSFISVDKGLLTSPVRKVCRILVEMDISRGLPETLEIEWRGRCLLQRLDYLGIPFQCSLCRSTRHLHQDCRGLFEEQEEQEDHLSTTDYIDLSIDTRFYSAGPGVCSPDLEEPEQTTTLSDKLKSHCPSFFSTLTSLEKESLSSSNWLARSISLSCPLPEMGVNDLSKHVIPSVSTLSSCILTKSVVDPSLPLLGNLSKSFTLPNSICPSSLIDTVSTEPFQTSSPVLNASSPIISGFCEPEESKPSLEAVLNSFIPFLKDNSSFNQLPVFPGKALQVTSSIGGETSGSFLPEGTKAKDFVWSRGLGFETSPIKTQSVRKKQNKDSQSTGPIISTDCGALRACKALARAK